ncbi:MAG: prepilin-type N-terminal cleavage/methylation domain-containing protein, partial [Deltaproteobacteria bacterium]|nr:prepilin-type N-terminal cleavage/methylation domain-containing protein [Deltaproteobacteria bacterium]
MIHGRIKNKNGFTFIELLTVMMIIAIISAIIFSRYMFGDTDLIAQTEVIKTHIRYGQSQAMNSD